MSNEKRLYFGVSLYGKSLSAFMTICLSLADPWKICGGLLLSYVIKQQLQGM